MATSEFDPIALARAEAIDTAHEPEDVGEFVTSEAHDDGVTDFRFEALMKGYEGWQWSVTLYHDVELDHSDHRRILADPYGQGPSATEMGALEGSSASQ